MSTVLRRLDYLLAVDREGHFGRAAAACHVSQPALSAGIAKLEAELGVPLVVRGSGSPGGRTAGLTPEGRALVPRAREAVAAASALTSEAGRLRGRLTGVLRLGAVPTAAAVAPAVVAPMLRAHPGVRVRIRSLAAERQAEALRTRDLDAGLAYADPAPAGLHVRRLYRERLVLVSSADRWHREEPTTAPWSALADEPLCLLTPEMHHRRVVDAALQDAGVQVEPRIEADGLGVLLDLVGEGWSTVVGEQWVVGRTLPRDARVVPLVRPVVAPWVGLLTLDVATPSPLVVALRSVLPDGLGRTG